MPRPRPQPAALALVIADFVSQLRIPQSRQRIRRKELSLPRRVPLRIPSPSIVPLRGRSARLAQPRRKHPLHVSFRSSQRLPQVNDFPLLPRRTYQRPVPPHILSRNPPRLPIPRPPQPRRSRVPGHPRCLLHRISALLFLLTLPRRIRKLLPRSLPRILRRIRRRTLPRLTPLRPPQSRRHRTHHQHHKPSPTLCPPCPLC